MTGVLRHILFVLENPLDPRDVERLGIARMIARGIRVTAVDASPFLRPKYKPVWHKQPARIEAELLTLRAEADGKIFIAAARTADLIVCVAGYTGSTRALRLYRWLTRVGKPYLVISAGAYPSPVAPPSGRRKIAERLADALYRARFGRIDPVRSILGRIPARLLGIRPPDFVVLGGRLSLAAAANFPVSDKTRRIHAHSLDYDVFRAARDAKHDGKLPGADFAVFIDESTGFQRDLLVAGPARQISPESFYPKLRFLFDRVEKELGLAVVIAGNPRADYSGMPGLFGERRVEYGATARLVTQSRLVLAHRSTAIGYAVMAGKPVLQIATREQYRHFMNKGPFDAFAQALNKPVQFIDAAGEADLGLAFQIDADRYAAYMRDYVKLPGTPDGLFWDVVLAEVERHLAQPSVRAT